jgi:hypothetical protein
MSEWIYAWLLRLFPSVFRETYGEEALQLFRDRSRDEKGLFLGLRLWLDLLADLAVAVPRQYRYAKPALSSPCAQPDFGGTPGFHVLENDSIRPTSLVLGGVLATIALGGLAVLNGHSSTPMGEVSGPPSQRSANVGLAAFGGAGSPPPAIPDTPAGKVLRAWLDAFNSGDPTAMQAYSKTFDPAEKMPEYASPGFSRRTGGFDLLSVTSREPMLAHFHVKEKKSPTEGLGSILVNGTQTPTVAAFNMDPVPAGRVIKPGEEVTLDAAAQRRVIDGAIANLKEYYVYPDVAQQMADALLAHEKNGDDNAETDGGIFAGMLTAQMRAVSHDRHLRVTYNPFKTQERASGGPTPEEMERYREDMKRSNCSFEKVGILPHNIGYLKFNEFPDPAVCKPTVEASMKSLGNVDAIIFDLRDNGGGDPHMVAVICSYLFDRRTHLNDIYNRRENTTQEFWTSSPIPRNTLAHKPAYVLTSAGTFSGAEEFSYDLKNLKRATLVGETTAGGAHLVENRRIDEHFAIGVPFARAINPISRKDWEGTGVEPDTKVNAADALETAEKLAESKRR